MYYVLAAALVVLLLWLNGRIWRSRWETKPTLHHYPATGGDGRTLVFMWTGAFNDVMIQSARQIPVLQQVGAVCAVRHPKKRYDADQAMLVAYDYALSMRDKYDTIILDGQSLGGGTALRLHAHIRTQAGLQRPTKGRCSRPRRGYTPVLKALLSDMPLSGRRLLQLPHAWLRWIVKHVHVGPLFNLLSAPIMSAVFKKMRLIEEDQADENQLTLHMEAMWRLTLSALVEQVVAIINLPELEKITDMETAYMMCDHDEVIDGPAAFNDVRELCGASLIGTMSVQGGHTQVVEKHIWWRKARVQMLGLMGYTVE